ncbi:MAG: hypothetical protein ACOYJJ_01895 [Anaerovoracaceae bacterium]
MGAQKEILATPLVKNKAEVEKETEKIIHTMLISIFFRKIYSIEEVLLIYVPFCVIEFSIGNAGKGKKAKALSHLAVSTDVSSGRMTPLIDPEDLAMGPVEVDSDIISVVKPDEEAIEAAARKELLFHVLPNNLRAWREYELEATSKKIFYRPAWLVHYKLFGKYHVYKTFGDPFNL